MKLFDYFYQWDYGHEWYLNVFCIKWVNVFQISGQWMSYPGRPIFLMSILGESLIGFTFTLYKFDLTVDFLNYRPRNLQEYRDEFSCVLK